MSHPLVVDTGEPGECSYRGSSVPDVHALSVQESAINHNQNSPRTSLLGLPTEQRLEIYSHLSPWRTGDDWGGWNCERIPPSACQICREKGDLAKFSGSYLGLLLSCRKLYTEASQVLYRSEHGVLGLNTAETPLPILYVSPEWIELRGYPMMFCRSHQAYLPGVEGLFRWVRRLKIEMEGWFNEAQTDNRPYENGLFGFHDKYQAMDNIRWVAKQLQCADQLEYLSLSADLEMEDVHEEERTPTLLNAKGLLQPFKCLRSIKKLEIGNLQLDMDTCIENGELPGNFPSLSARTLKKRRAEILGIREPVRPDPIPLDTWLDFKHTVNSILNNASCTTVARSLKSAAKAFEKQDKGAFCMAIFLLDTAWESEKKMGNMIESMFSRLEQTKFLDVELGKSRKDYPDGMESQEVD